MEQSLQVQSSQAIQPGQRYDTAMIMFNPEMIKAVEGVAAYMAKGRSTVPAHLQGNQGDCMAVTLQALAWGESPFIVAQKTHIVNGTLGYEGQLVHSILVKSGAIVGRPDFEYFGNWDKVVGKFVEKTSAKGNKYRAPNWTIKDEEGLGIIVRATLSGETAPKEYRLLLTQAATRNSTEWANDPQQQLSYLAIRKFVRRFCPDVMGGVYTKDELYEEGFDAPRDVTPKKESVSQASFSQDALKGAANPKLSAMLTRVQGATSYDELEGIKTEAVQKFSGADRAAIASAYNQRKRELAIDAEVVEAQASEENSPPAPTYAEIMSGIQKATNADDVDAELSLAGHLPGDQIKELEQAANKRKATFK